MTDPVCVFCPAHASVRAYDLYWCTEHLLRLYLGLCMVAP